jgi:hypothetical protein
MVNCASPTQLSIELVYSHQKPDGLSLSGFVGSGYLVMVRSYSKLP